MENKCGKCFRCRYFERYYTKGVKKFVMTDLGACYQRGREAVNKHDGCESYEPRQYKVRSNRLLRCVLSDILTQISEVRKMIEAEENERKDVQELQ